jgi:hypothetical protein
MNTTPRAIIGIAQMDSLPSTTLEFYLYVNKTTMSSISINYTIGTNTNVATFNIYYLVI